MKLRTMEKKDIIGILSWMKDPEVNQFFQFDANSVNEDTVTRFVENAQNKENNLHLAIVNEEDEYLGTVSLKEIDYINSRAEYAISLRKEAQGTGAALFATDEILKIAFNELGLNKVYLYVLSDNIRANKFSFKIFFKFLIIIIFSN